MISSSPWESWTSSSSQWKIWTTSSLPWESWTCKDGISSSSVHLSAVPNLRLPAFIRFDKIRGLFLPKFSREENISTTPPHTQKKRERKWRGGKTNKKLSGCHTSTLVWSLELLLWTPIRTKNSLSACGNASYLWLGWTLDIPESTFYLFWRHSIFTGSSQM